VLGDGYVPRDLRCIEFKEMNVMLDFTVHREADKCKNVKLEVIRTKFCNQAVKVVHLDIIVMLWI